MSVLENPEHIRRNNKLIEALAKQPKLTREQLIEQTKRLKDNSISNKEIKKDD